MRSDLLYPVPLKAEIMTKLGIALVVLGSGLQAIAADASATKPQIQGANVRLNLITVYAAAWSPDSTSRRP